MRWPPSRSRPKVPATGVTGPAWHEPLPRRESEGAADEHSPMANNPSTKPSRTAGVVGTPAGQWKWIRFVAAAASDGEYEPTAWSGGLRPGTYGHHGVHGRSRAPGGGLASRAGQPWTENHGA